MPFFPSFFPSFYSSAPPFLLFFFLLSSSASSSLLHVAAMENPHDTSISLPSFPSSFFPPFLHLSSFLSLFSLLSMSYLPRSVCSTPLLIPGSIFLIISTCYYFKFDRSISDSHDGRPGTFLRQEQEELSRELALTSPWP